jgi:arylsulfatase A-like enzyme
LRTALVAPPPSAIRFRVRVPPDAALTFGSALAGADGTYPTGSVEFRVQIDGREVFRRVADPAASLGSFPWQPARIDLGEMAGRELDVVLGTRRTGTEIGTGTPGWSRLRVVRSSSHDRQRATAEQPSLVLIVVDSLRADRLGCYGARPSLTPTVDAIAATGTLCEQAIAQAPWTLPAVATIFTGLHPQSHGVVGGRWRWGESDTAADLGRAVLPESIPTLAERAQRAGITTVAVSANGLISPTTGLMRGFEHPNEVGGRRTGTHFARAARVNERFLRWLGDNRGQRFFAYLHYMDTHAPYEPPAPFRPPGSGSSVASGVHGGRIDEFRATQNPLDAAALADLRALYDGAVRYWDSQLAELRRGLDALGVTESTILVVTADHGEGFQEHGYLGHGVHLHDELLRVPLVIAGPGIAAGRRIPGQVQQVDVLPTVAALLEVPIPPLPGTNLLVQRPEAAAVASTAFWHAPDGSRADLVAWRTPAWKLLHAPALERYELYNLARDPGEQQDRFRTAPEAGTLAAALSDWQRAAPAPPETGPEDPAVREKLRALGYVQ